jgi:pyruvate dehydrogenase E2 component (dihydrolipoamide acetyltransferase)
VIAKAASASPQISPKARRLAKELGVDFSRVQGTGPEGVITAEDVQKFADAKGAVAAVATSATTPAGEALSQVARLMAERTTQSWTSVPHFFLVREVDASGLIASPQHFSNAADKTKGAAPTITDLLIALIARTLVKHPRMNASWTEGGVRMNPEVNISVAIAVKDGVVGAVIHKADTLKIVDISTQRLELTERARAGRLRPVDIAGGTFTLSNLGMYKVDAFSAIITPPQAAVLAVGMISDRVVALDGKPAVRPMMTMTLSSDHRVVDGARAAEFLNDLAEAIREPMKLL